MKTGEKQPSKKKTAGFISEVEQRVIKNTNYKIVNWVLSLKRFFFSSQVLKHFDPWVPHRKKKFINFVSLVSQSSLRRMSSGTSTNGHLPLTDTKLRSRRTVQCKCR